MPAHAEIYIPHRNPDLRLAGGYHWGVSVKQAMLAFEAAA